MPTYYRYYPEKKLPEGISRNMFKTAQCVFLKKDSDVVECFYKKAQNEKEGWQEIESICIPSIPEKATKITAAYFRSMMG